MAAGHLPTNGGSTTLFYAMAASDVGALRLSLDVGNLAGQCAPGEGRAGD